LSDLSDDGSSNTTDQTPETTNNTSDSTPTDTSETTSAEDPSESSPTSESSSTTETTNSSETSSSTIETTNSETGITQTNLEDSLPDYSPPDLLPDDPLASIVEEVNTLVELPVALETSISYYYPYFYQTHLITFAEDNLESIHFVSICSIKNCAKCDTDKCYRCKEGHYLNNEKCISKCPDNYYADILRQKCMHKETSDLVYNVAYSIGSCKNMCGKTVKDCSCKPICKNLGNCCTDYDHVKCDYIFDKALEVTEKPTNCIYAENIEGGVKCNQCDGETYFYQDKCLEKCPTNYIFSNTNRYCRKPQSIYILI
jgi:hypothetical protein